MRIERDENKATIFLVGKLGMDKSQKFREHLIEIYQEDHQRLILDFADAIIIDSSILGIILSFFKKFKAEDRTIEIINVNSNYIKKTFYMTNLDAILDIKGLD